jgi:hypothetical protein
MAAGAIALLVASAFTGVVLAGTPAPYEGGWYRYFDECEFRGLQEVAAMANAEPRALVVTGSWQSQLVVGAFTDGAGRVWYKKEVFSPTYHHDNFVITRRLEGRTTFMVVDKHLPSESPGADWSFLDRAPWERVLQQCPGQGAMALKLTVYVYRPPGAST